MMTGVATSQTVTLPSAVRKQLPDPDTAAARPRRDIDPHNLLHNICHGHGHTEGKLGLVLCLENCRNESTEEVIALMF